MPDPQISYIIPVYNEVTAIASTISRLHAALSNMGLVFEIIVVDDGSTDGSGRIAEETLEGVKVIRHPVNSGYGRALKSGIRAARYDWIGIVDADGTYPIDELPKLVEKIRDGFDMVVAHRKNVLQADRPLKRFFRRVFIWSMSILLNRKIKDPNSGFRLFRRRVVMDFLPFLCDAFSFTTSLTVFAFGAGLFVSYVPVPFHERHGESKVRHFRDSIRTAQLLVQGITYTNPVKFFLLLAFVLFMLVIIPTAGIFLISSSVAIYCVLSGTAIAVLVGMGVLCDTIRIAITRQEWSRMLAGKDISSPPTSLASRDGPKPASKRKAKV